MRFPDSYAVFDVETTGLVFGTDLVTQVGWCLIDNRKSVSCGSALLDWTRCDAVNQDWLMNRMANTKRQMEAKGKNCHMTYERLYREGCDPKKVLENYVGILSDARSRGLAFLAHNAWGFDIPMLHSHFERFGPKFEFKSDEVYDSGVMVKASQLSIFPEPNESRKSFYMRVHKQRAPGVYWSLDSYCVDKFRLHELAKLDPANSHDAGYDCHVTHLLFERLRDMAETVENKKELVSVSS